MNAKKKQTPKRLFYWLIHFSDKLCSHFFSPFALQFVLPAYDAFACARVPQCQLHLWVSFPATFSLYALGSLYSCLSNSWVSCRYKVFLFDVVLKIHLLDVIVIPHPLRSDRCFPDVLFYSGQDNDINLMKACWNELFALGLAQCSNVMNVGTILSAIIAHLQTSLQEGRGSSVTLRGKPIMPCSLLKLTLLHSSKLVFFCVYFVSYRQAVPRPSKTSNGAHLEDAGVL